MKRLTDEELDVLQEHLQEVLKRDYAANSDWSSSASQAYKHVLTQVDRLFDEVHALREMLGEAYEAHVQVENLRETIGKMLDIDTNA